MDQQPVAVDQGVQPPQGVAADGKPIVDKQYDVALRLNTVEVRKTARFFAGQMGNQPVADRMSATIGEGAVKVGLAEKHPFKAGVATGILAVGVGYGVYRAAKWYRARRASQAALTQVGGKVIRIPATGTR